MKLKDLAKQIDAVLKANPKAANYTVVDWSNNELDRVLVEHEYEKTITIMPY